MQTFMPYPDFKRSAEVLDRQRLGKQRSEALVLLRICRDGKSRWKKHPIWKMWAKNPEALALYGVVICEEWTRRGYKDTCKEKILAANREMGGAELEELRRKYEEREDGFHGRGSFHVSVWSARVCFMVSGGRSGGTLPSVSASAAGRQRRSEGLDLPRRLRSR